MRKLTILLLACGLISTVLFAQRPASDVIKTDKGDITIHPIFHGTLALEWNDMMVYVDPYNGAEGFKGLKKPDIILITDIHPDHLDIKTLEALDTEGAKIIAPQAVVSQLPEELKGQSQTLFNGGSMNISDLLIKAMPMYNLPMAEDAFHTKGRGNGYLLEAGGKTIYISGDTEDIEEMRALENIDVAFVCMNLPYTMDIDQAANAVLEFKPKIVYPYHYRGKDGMSDTEAFKKKVNSGNPDIEVRLRDWYTGS